MGKRPSRFGAMSWRGLLSAVAVSLAIVAVVVVVSLIPLPYVVQNSGPTVDVLRDQGGVAVLDFSQSGEPSDFEPRTPSDSDGELRMVTVSEKGGPGTQVRLGDLVSAWFSPSATIRRYSDLYAPDTTAAQVKEAGVAQMQSSHSTATTAAMEQLGIPVETTLTVAGTIPGGGSYGILEEDDVLVSITTEDGVTHPIDKPSVPFRLLQDLPGGTPLEVEVLRDGKPQSFEIITAVPEGADPEDGSKLGIYLDAQTELPFDLQIRLEKIGGPSAGLVFALGIINALSDTDTTGGEKIAATGALDYAAQVIPIGGVKQKMFGAKRDGASWFLVPEKNCPSVIGNEPEGLRVVPVGTLEEGVSAVDAIASGAGDSLPTCETIGTL